jgi:CheY-like chemotaxis protein
VQPTIRAASSFGLAGFPALLIERGLIPASDLAAAHARAAREGMDLVDVVVAYGVAEADSYAALATAAGAEMIPLERTPSSELAVRLVPERLARRHSVVALEVDNRQLTYATCRPFNAESESDLGFACGRRIAVKVATRSAVTAALDLCYPKVRALAAVASRPTPRPAAAAAPLPEPGTAASATIDRCHEIIAHALEMQAADVHLECGVGAASIKYRIGAVLHPPPAVPPDLRGIMERFKIMASVGTAVRDRSQNGAFLATVKNRVADVRLSTRPTAGGDVMVMRVIDAAARHAADPRRPKVAKPGRRRVLVTDDEPITRMLVKVLLERDRYDVLEAANGQEALDVAIRECPSLVLIDLNMPVMDGYEAIGALRREFTMSALPIIVLTAEDGDSVQRRVLELGADDYLIKPFEADVLMARVNAVFRRLHLVAA